MREIKFRAWYESEKVMMYQDKLNNKNQAKWFWEYVGSLDKIEVMQFTGLKDSKGVEIYEGDIVFVNGEWGESRYEVKWEEAGWFPFQPDSHGRECASSPRYSEINGNIYENPELLEKQKES